jgi:predicted Zn-dependent peptidase
MSVPLRALGLAGVLALAGGSGCRSPYVLNYAAPAHIDLTSERYRLANGLEVILSADHSVPFVAVDLWYHVGSKDDPPGRAGLAHLFEHLMFDGSRHVPEGGHQAMLADVGARDVNAATSFDQTSFYETVMPGSVDLALWLESDRMASLLDVLDADRLNRERKVVENERLQRFDDQPYGMVPSFVWAASFPEPHPYHHAPIGDLTTLESITLEDTRSFFRSFYSPSNCTLTLVGDFDPAAMKQTIARYFAPVPVGAPPPKRPDVAPSTLSAEKRLIIEADVPRGRIEVAWPVVPRFAPGSVELELGAAPLAGYMAKELVDRQKLATRVTAVMHAGHLASLFEVSIDLAPGASPEKALDAFDEQMHLIRALHSRFDRVQFAISRARLLAEPIYMAERYVTRAELLQLYNQEAGTPDYANTELDARESVIVEDVRKAYYDLLRWDARVVTIVLPKAGAPRSGRLVRST